MAIEVINRGTSANDGTGDNIREAFRKVNDNFDQVLTNDTTDYTDATTPLAGTEIALVEQGGTFKKVAVSEFNSQIYQTISTNTTLDNTYHSATVWVTATCNVTIPSGLRSDFYCNIRTFAGATATYLTSGTVINTESDGDVQAPSTMINISTFSTNNFILSGGGLS